MRMFVLVAALALLAACARAPSGVHFHAQGMPEKLSDWNVVAARGGELALSERVVPFDLNTPLFSDYAHKLRTVWMPEGKSATYRSDASFEFPVGTILSKTFYYPVVPHNAPRDNRTSVARLFSTEGDFTARRTLDLSRVRLIETRLLVRREDGWIALPYVWNDAQTDALLERTGAAIAMSLVDEHGEAEPLGYQVPDQNQCANCHVTDVRAKQLLPLGPKARHLNREYAYADGVENQLARWTRLGILEGAPAPAHAPRNADWHDASQNLTARARAYLDVNCGHCHSATGPANTTALALDIDAPADLRIGLCKPPVAAGRGTGDHFFDLVPGQPDDSILVYRMASTEPGVMMPEQGRSVVHREGLALIRDWIAAWPGPGCT